MNSRKATRNGLGVLGAFGAGAMLMYLLDPARGKRRRHLLRDKLAHSRRMAGESVGGASRDIRNRAMGMAAEARATFRSEPVSDVVLTERVRSELGRVVSHPGAITVVSGEGHVILGGHVLAAEADRLLSAVKRVRGVRGVDNRLQAHETPFGVSSLQGGRADRAGEAANDRHSVRVQKTLTVRAPVEKVFSHFAEFERWPEWMTHVREVQRAGTIGGDERTHWVVDGPAGVPVSWDAMTTQFVHNEVIGWKSLEGERIRHAGLIRFTPTDDGATLVNVRMSYDPPADAVGHVIAEMFRRDPRHQMNDDLARLKTLIEQGRPAHDAARRKEADRSDGDALEQKSTGESGSIASGGAADDTEPERSPAVVREFPRERGSEVPPPLH